MTYTSVDELPSEVRRALSVDDAKLWMEAYEFKLEELSSSDSASELTSPAFIAREYAWSCCKFLPSSRYVMSNVSTEVVDRDGDVADVEDYVLAGQEFVNAGGQVARNHSNKTVGVVWKVEKGIDAKTDKPCVISYINFFRGKPTYDRAWNDFKTGKLGWSIGSIVSEKRECNQTTCYNVLHPIQWFELSLVDYPRNPITYDVEMNETAKGDASSIIEIHEEECPILKKYLEFKSKLVDFGIEAHIVEGGVMLLIGDITADAENYIFSEYPDYYDVHHQTTEDGKSIALLIPDVKPVDSIDDFLDTMLDLIKDEKEAIQAYLTVTRSLQRGLLISEEDIEKVTKSFEEVIRDEESHIGVILNVIKLVNPEMYSSIAEGMDESEEAMKGCPAGQHEHAGVVGCHDIFRKHSVDYQTNPMDKLDLTDENIDVNAIKNTPTPKLKEIVVKIAKVLSTYDKDSVKNFMSHTAGKEFVLAYLELKRRQTQKGDDELSENTDTSAPAKVEEQTEADKGLLADPQTSIATISSTLASIVPLIDGMNARLLRIESALASQTEQDTDITSAILSDSNVVGGEEEKMPAPAVADTDKADMPPVDTPVAESAGDAEESDKPVPDEEKSEEDDESEEKEEGTEEDKESSDDSEDKDEDSDEEEKSEDKEEESEDKEEKDEDKDKEAKKGSEEEPAPTEVVEEKAEVPVVAETEMACKAEEPAPVATEAETACKAEEPVVETTEAEAKPEEPIVQAPVVEERVPIPAGGNNVDFRSAVLKRQEELKQKGVNFSVSNGVTSLAQQPAAISAKGGVSLVQPSNNISPFVGGMPRGAYSGQELWKDMGKYDPKTFFNKLKGE